MISDNSHSYEQMIRQSDANEIQQGWKKKCLQDVLEEWNTHMKK